MKKIIIFFGLLISLNVTAQIDSLNGWFGIPFGSTKEFVKQEFYIRYPESIINEENKNYISFNKNIKFAGYNVSFIRFEFINNKFFCCHITYSLLDSPSPLEIENILKEKYHKFDRFEVIAGWLIEYWDFFGGNQISMTLIGSEKIGMQIDYICGFLYEEYKIEILKKDNEKKINGIKQM